MDQHGEQAQGLPLKGVVLCSTSVTPELRIQLADYAVEMGAVHNLDLTGEVTHLIVGDVRTPKYRYVAKARPDIKVLHPDWIEELRTQWLSGEDVDVAAIEEQHKFPTLGGLHICVTGFTTFEERSELEKIILQHGATYTGDLTKQVTQLIVATTQGAKYTHARQWGIPCVSLKWLTDSIVRTMALDESLYDPQLPEEEQGRGAYRLDTKPKTTIGKRARDDQQVEDAGKRKLRRTASTRLEEHSQDLWQDISVLGDTKNSTAADQWREDVADQDKKSTSAQPRTVKPITDTLAIAKKLFSGWRICLQGFEASKKEKLRHVLHDQCGAEVVDNASELRLGNATSHCILIPHHPPQSLYYLSRSSSDTVIATEWWVERCIYSRTVLDTQKDTLSRPLWEADLPNMSGTSISSTGLNSVDLRQMAVVVAKVGAVYQEQLAPTTSVLVSASSNVKREKAYYAEKHNIPVVSTDWLWSSLQMKRKQHFEPFRIALDGQDLSGSRVSRGSIERSKGSLSSKSGAARPQARLSGSSKPAAALQLKTKGPFIHDDNDQDDSAQHLETGDLPLKERSPNVSPRKRRSPTKDKNLAKLDDIPVLSVQDQASHGTEHVQTPKELNEDIAQLSYKLQASRSGAVPNDTGNAKRKKRTLGRAASAISNKSGPTSAEQSIEERLDLWDDQNGQVPVPAEAAPSTQLGYEVPEAEAHRIQMAKRMGTSFADEHGGTKLASIGTVRDAEARTRSRRQKVVS